MQRVLLFVIASVVVSVAVSLLATAIRFQVVPRLVSHEEHDEGEVVA
jgi:hypothetical protein